MSENLLKLISESNSATHLISKSGHFCIDDIVGVSLLFAAVYSKKPANYVIISSNLYNAQKISSLIGSLIGSDNVLLYPGDDVLRCELLTSSKELLSQRLFVLNELENSKKKIVVTHASSILTPLPPKKEFEEACFDIQVGDKFNINNLKKKLIQSGYYCVNKIHW